MSLLKFYLILTALGILIDILVIILCDINAAAEQIVICLTIAVLLLIIGVSGAIRKVKSYVE